MLCLQVIRPVEAEVDMADTEGEDQALDTHLADPGIRPPAPDPAAVMATADKGRILRCHDIILNLTFDENKYLLTATLCINLGCRVRIKDDKFVHTKFACDSICEFDNLLIQ